MRKRFWALNIFRRRIVRIGVGGWGKGYAPQILHTEFVIECVVLVLYSPTQKFGAMGHIKYGLGGTRAGLEKALKWFQKEKIPLSEVRAYIYYNANWMVRLKLAIKPTIKILKDFLSRNGITPNAPYGHSQYIPLVVDFDLKKGEPSFSKDTSNFALKALRLDHLFE
ncbi:TPA: hypothetical protein H1005_00070 [archaeon]|uniref:Uncharacterized protein n=1 Tax=Candidatus Naiadarchaeum limnaeum TaxID=2756139 RepID=A0A832V0T6_9ARCH|nr:hypothetical protein [Candidatus Naiadarchaeales archaeon SRR2090153.bin1042]HIK00011.1 hypothetical protein [Candidatus Naiadarchaeum limnaeum]